MGRFQGTVAEWTDWYNSGDLDAAVPRVWQEAFILLGYTMDDIRRMKTGAAASASEDAFYKELVGSMTKSAHGVFTRMDILMDMMNSARSQPLITALEAKYRGVVPGSVTPETPLGTPIEVPRDVLNTLPRSTREQYLTILAKQAAFNDGSYQSENAIKLLRYGKILSGGTYAFPATP
jgi:hypothetical protein